MRITNNKWETYENGYDDCITMMKPRTEYFEAYGDASMDSVPSPYAQGYVDAEYAVNERMHNNVQANDYYPYDDPEYEELFDDHIESRDY